MFVVDGMVIMCGMFLIVGSLVFRERICSFLAIVIRSFRDLKVEIFLFVLIEGSYLWVLF